MVSLDANVIGCWLYRDGSGCPILYWEEDYIQVLRNNGVSVSPVNGPPTRMQVPDSKLQGAQPRVHPVIEGSDLVGIGKEIVSVLKGICFVCVCIMSLLLLNLLVQFFK